MSARPVITAKPRAAALAAPRHALLAGLVLLGLLLAMALAAPLARAAQETADEVIFPLGEFNDGKARHYSLKSPQGITVRYFLLKAKDGSIRAAFDACDVCWRSNKGFYQEGDNMVCKNCGRRFSSVQVGQQRGGCNPGPLALSVEGDQVRIKKADIIEGQHYFDFNKR